MSERIRNSEKGRKREWTKEEAGRFIEEFKDISGYLNVDEKKIDSITDTLASLEDFRDSLPSRPFAISSVPENNESWIDKLSPARRKLKKEQRKKEKELKSKLEFEATHTLGTIEDNQTSDISSSGWRVYHPKKDPNVVFQKTNIYNSGLFGSGINFTISNNVSESLIAIKKYMDSNNSPRIIFDILQKVDTGTVLSMNGKTVKVYNYNSIDKKILRIESSETIESDVVCYENGRLNVKYYYNFKVTGNGNGFTSTVVQASIKKNL